MPDDQRRSGPGRPPGLNYTPGSVKLRPDQWAWLREQPEGISGTLRDLVDAAKQVQRA